MRVIVAGSRDFSDWEYVEEKLYSTFENRPVDTIVSGTAKGPDSHGIVWAEAEGITVMRFPADWENKGRGAGFIRNAEMAEYSDALIAFWDGESKGTKHMIDTALKGKLEVHVYIV